MKTIRNTSSGIAICLAILFTVIGGQKSFSQGVGISEAGITPDPSSILELRSVLRGFLAPRMTTVQRGAIASPATGLIIYNTDTNTFNYYNGTVWIDLLNTGTGVSVVNGTLNRISVGGTPSVPVIDIDPNYIGQASITTLGTIISGTWNGTKIGLAYGGTNTNLSGGAVVGDIIYANAATTLARLADVATGNALISGGIGSAPSWGKIGLTTHVSGTLPIGNGGTGSVTQNFVDLTTAQTIGGVKTFSSVLTSTVATGTAPFTVTSTTPVTNLNIGGNAATATTTTNLVGGLGGSIPYQSGANTTVMLANGSAGQVLTSAGTTLPPTWSNPSTGSVTSVSVVTANGLAGTVATATSTPAITLSTTVTGMLKGNGTAISAATSGTDYMVPNGAITAATKTKITYDTKGLVTAGADATTADITPSLNRNYVTDAQLIVINNTSNTNSGNVTLTAIGSAPNANGASLSGQALTLQPANGSFGGVLTAGVQTIAGIKTFLSDLIIDPTGSNTGAPRNIGITTWVASNAVRFMLGNAWNSLQNAYSYRMQITAFNGIDIAGNRESPTPLGFVAGAFSDASLNVVGTTATAPVLTVTSAAGQSGNMQEWRNSAGIVLASITSAGAISGLNGVTIANGLKGGGGTPGITPDVGAGTGPTMGISGTNLGGEITITTGTGPVAGVLMTIAFANSLSFPNGCSVQLSAGNLSAAQINGANKPYISATNLTNFIISVPAALTATTQYIWYYQVVGY